ncbi:Hypp4121 [Branchiostoma lanceolatum]|uniref:Hypp4121 protein n=1 Tax=Branchiostoma lanceolatum TaxID=7740 RepID=A0A8K0EZT4_BRALA|nr:Hypp4121 [Branchiostoma lanceolatum]
MTTPSYIGNDEATADVMHSAHSGETTLLREKPTSTADVMHSAHSGETTLLREKPASTADVMHSAHSGETTLLREKPASTADVTHSAHSGETTLLREKPASTADVTHSAHSGETTLLREKPASTADVTHSAHSGETTLLREKPTSTADVMHSAHSGETTLLREKPASTADVMHSAHSGETTLLREKTTSTADVMHSAHSGETTLLREKTTSTADVMHSAHSGETTLLREKPASTADVTHSAHSGETTLLHLKPGSTADVMHSAHSGETTLLREKPASTADVMHSAHSGETTLLREKPASTADVMHSAHSGETTLLRGHADKVSPIDNTTAVPADRACLRHGFDDLDVKTVHNPFKNVCIQRRSIDKSTAPRFEALKRYWIEKISLNGKVRNSTHLPTSLPDLADLDGYDNFDFIGPYFSYRELGAFNGLDLTTGYNFSENVRVHSRLARRLQEMTKTDVDGRKTSVIDQFLEEEVRRNTHPRKAVPIASSEYSVVDGFKNSDIITVNKTLSATDTISVSKLIQPSSSFNMTDNGCLDNKDAVLLKNSTDPNLFLDSVNVTTTHDESCRVHDQLMRIKTTVAVVVGTLAVTSAIYDYMT